MKTITITLTIPDGVGFNAVTTTTPVQNAPQAAASHAGASTGVCPKHGAEKVKPSKFGGVYCTAQDDSEEKGYCAWKQK